MALPLKITNGQVLNYDYTGNVQSIMLPPGSYKLECWGAQGGYRSSATYGGKGGYSVGELTLNEETMLYVQVGRSGGYAGDSIYTTETSGGYNGGGKRDSGSPGGGGATDIRIGQDSLYARVIVAGGGGSDGANNKKGMYGGGESGGSSTESYGTGGFGGTQTGVSDSSWQTTSQSTGTGTATDAYAGFGFGGNGVTYSSGYGGAGGGGWYGGSGAYPDSGGDDDRGGGGGSGYIYTSSTASNYPSGCLLNSSYYLTNAQTIAGNASFPSPTSGSTETGHSGNGYARITVLTVKSPIKIKKGQIFNCEFSGGVEKGTFPAGTYKLEVWGAQGGNYNIHYGGAGGYSVGTLTIIENTDFYICVGGQPVPVSTDRVVTPGGYNGGGAGFNRYYNSTYTLGQGGGGATDIRIGQDSLYARVIVAGGGGGSASNGDEKTTKYGGGLTGGCVSANFAGTQTSGGVGDAGSFGKGGAAPTGGDNYKYGPGGGGGGWYGGGVSTSYSDSETDIRGYNGGGSGYVYTANTATNYPSGCLLNSTYYLTEATTIGGNESFPSTSGGTETGHEGNGYARITVLSIKSPISAPVRVDGQWHQANELFVKVNNVWKACVEGWMKVDGVWKSLAESAITYNASWLNGLTVGDTFYFGKYQVESETPWPIEWEIVHQTDDYQIAMTKQIIDLRCFDAKESQNVDGGDRYDHGSNNWSMSNIKQFLNSDQVTWYSAQHELDEPPVSPNIGNSPKTPYDTHKGFLYYFSKGEKSLLKNMTLTLANPEIDGGDSYTWTGKVWLPTYTQMTGSTNSTISEGTKFDKYTNDKSRKKTINKYCAENNPYAVSKSYTSGTAWSYWMSSEQDSETSITWIVESTGLCISSYAYDSSIGLAPCICLPRHDGSQVTTYELSKFGSYVNTVKVNGTAVTLPIQVAVGATVEVTSTGYDASAYSMIWSGPTPTSNRTASSGSTTTRIVTFVMPSEDVIIRFNRKTASSETTYTISKGNNVASIFINNGSSITTSTNAKPGDTITVHSNSFSTSTVSAITWAGTGVPTANISYNNYVTIGSNRYRKITFTMPANNVTTAFRKTSSGGSTDM